MSPDRDREEIARLWQEISAERRRATRAAELAEAFERQAQRPPESMQPFRLRMAALHRAMEARHLACARLHRRHVLRLQKWDPVDVRHRPVFMATVAEQFDVDSAAVTLFGQSRDELLVAASDVTSRAAQELECTVSEGPARTASQARGAVLVSGGDLLTRWPRYGPAVSDLGIRSIVAVPLHCGANYVGALCGFTTRGELPEQVVSAATSVADTLANSLLLAADGLHMRLDLFEDADYLATAHQASGMVAVRCDCDIDTALALLRARAFAMSAPIGEIARQVIDGTCQIC
ncbi:GAF domain-containing protein [Nocardia sp. NPDC051030]|uniref:GAF domain-containing protein n=1 Tax=Nocardia sp. NPDC051030 TaxID=3155162 RepID=UPI0034162A82